MIMGHFLEFRIMVSMSRWENWGCLEQYGSYPSRPTTGTVLLQYAWMNE